MEESMSSGFQRLPIRHAIPFLRSKGLGADATIANAESSFTRKRARIVQVLEQHGLLDEFIDTYWPNGREQDGERRLESLRRVSTRLANIEDATEEDEDEVIEEAEQLKFGLERDLQVALRRNIEQLDPGLNIIDGGSERRVEAGRIDITAQDQNGKLVAIELKAGVAGVDSITQILSYMGSLKSEGQTTVRGILVAGEFPRRVVLAAQAVPNLQLKRYSFSFSFEDC